MAGLKWNTGNLYYSTVELGYQQRIRVRIRGSSRKKVGNFNTMNIKFGIVGNDNLGGVGVGL